MMEAQRKGEKRRKQGGELEMGNGVRLVGTGIWKSKGEW